jgi:hypothetical protein
MSRAADAMVGRCAAAHIMRVLMTSSGVVDAAANAPAKAPMPKSSCNQAAETAEHAQVQSQRKT